MPKLNQLESEILSAASKAHNMYENLTGYWLFHSPEHLLQDLMFLELGKKWLVFIEANRKRLSEQMGKSPMGRPPLKRYRYDLVVWHRSTDTLRAVIEIKRSLIMTDVMKNDANRIRKAINSQPSIKSGYLLVYSEIEQKSGQNALAERFDRWSVHMDLQLIGSKIIEYDEKESDYLPGFALYRA
jgi:hypothetical protein